MDCEEKIKDIKTYIRNIIINKKQKRNEVSFPYAKDKYTTAIEVLERVLNYIETEERK